MCVLGLVVGALKGEESKGFGFDYQEKIYFLLAMTDWWILEITAFLLNSPSDISVHWSNVSLEITPGKVRYDVQLYRPSFPAA